VIALLTTARKASNAAILAFLSPPVALVVSDQPLTFRVVLASVLLGLIAGLSTYETSNTDVYEPRHSGVQ